MPITFKTSQEANEFAERPYTRIWKENGKWYGETTSRQDQKKARGTIKDLSELEKDLDEKEERLNVIREASGGGAVGGAKKAIKGVVKGLNAFNENVKNPKRRMRISQTPANRSEMPITLRQTTNPVSGRNAGMKRHHISNVPRNVE